MRSSPLPPVARCLKPDKRTLSLLQRCNLNMAGIKQIHAHLVVSGAVADTYVAGKILAFCAISERGDLAHAHLLFRGLPRPTIFLWNTLMRAHVERREPCAAIALYGRMLADGYLPNNYTFSFALRACLDLSALTDGRKLHAQIVKIGWEPYDFVQNGLIHMYASCGCIDSARKVFDHSLSRDVISWTAMVHGYAKSGQIEEARRLFDRMPARNAVSWSAMITGYVQIELFQEALVLFNEMQLAGVHPNHAGIVGALTACAFLGALDQGRWIHSYVERNKLELDRILGTALIDMYAKCGCIETAWQVFCQMPERDVFAYTSMISGFSNHGLSRKAIELFAKMQNDDVKPNEVTLISVLTACSRMGLVAEGKNFFENMSSAYGIQPGLEHYGCLVDLLGRAGLLGEATRVVREMPMKPDSYVLGALLNACRVRGEVELAKETVESLEDLGLDHGGVYVLLSNIYASANRWHYVAGVRKGMEYKKVRKVPGCSMIEVDGVACEFVSGNRSHWLMERIVATLKLMNMQLRLFNTELCTNIVEPWYGFEID
uniref:Pentatricopeptide repeat-containing protein At5g66520 n=1 Tax=Anthurium amnicola TaxID=1678845 RepID=A0A1D1YFZ6_9ARAE